VDLDYDLNHVYHHNKNLRNSKSYPSNKKFCHICIINGHSSPTNVFSMQRPTKEFETQKITKTKESIKRNINIITKNKLDRKNKPYISLIMNNRVIGTFYSSIHKIIHMTINPINTDSHNLLSIKIDNDNVKTWHNRLGHFFLYVINKYIKLNKIKPLNCTECRISKINKDPFNGTPPRDTEILETIHSDIVGPKGPSITNKKYFITFIDEFSQKAWLYLLEEKSQATKIIIQFLTFIENQYNKVIKTFKSDIGKEYKNKRIFNFCNNKGINKVFSTPYNPQINGLAERFNRTIVDCTRTLLFTSKLNTKFWDFAIKYATHLYNITPHSSINN